MYSSCFALCSYLSIRFTFLLPNAFHFISCLPCLLLFHLRNPLLVLKKLIQVKASFLRQPSTTEHNLGISKHPPMSSDTGHWHHMLSGEGRKKQKLVHHEGKSLSFPRKTSLIARLSEQKSKDLKTSKIFVYPRIIWTTNNNLNISFLNIKDKLANARF